MKGVSNLRNIFKFVSKFYYIQNVSDNSNDEYKKNINSTKKIKILLKKYKSTKKTQILLKSILL